MTAQEIIETERELFKYPEEKRYLSEQKIRCLIAAGADVRRGHLQEGGSYYTEVIYQGLCFCNASPYPLIPSAPLNTTIH